MLADSRVVLCEIPKVEEPPGGRVLLIRQEHALETALGESGQSDTNGSNSLIQATFIVCV